jgi:hypothetical protein
MVAARISEIEHIIAREQDFAFKPEGVLDTRADDWENVLPPEQRTSRAAMICSGKRLLRHVHRCARGERAFRETL